MGGGGGDEETEGEDTDGEEQEGDYTVYECPGLAAVGTHYTFHFRKSTKIISNCRYFAIFRLQY